MARHKGLNIKVGDKIFRDVDKMDRRQLWDVQDAISRKQGFIRLALHGNVSPATVVLLNKQYESLRRRATRVDHLIRSLPATLIIPPKT
jgi:hypothetical protein